MRCHIFFRHKNDSVGNPLEELSCRIHDATARHRDYVKNNFSDTPDKMNYRHFMALSFELGNAGVLTYDEIALLQAYIIYCAKCVIDVRPKNEWAKIAVSELKGVLPVISLFGNIEIGIGKIEKIKNQIMFYGNRESTTLSFESFKNKLNRMNES